MKRIYLFLILPLFLASHAANAATLPDVVISSTKLLQADTLLVAVKNEPGEVSGSFGAVKLRFFRSEKGADWVAITGAAVNKAAGTYRLTVNVQGKTSFKKSITVSKRKFPITSFVITQDLAEKGFTHTSVVNNIKNLEKKMLDTTMATLTPTSYISKPFIYPLSEIVVTGGYGHIRKSKQYTIQHLGVDLKAPIGTSVQAVNDGKVVFRESLPDYGNTLVVDHGLGMYSLYLHLSEFKAEKDQMVSQGEAIALAGDTGYAIGPHLHFSIKVRGASLDPLKFIEASHGTTW